MNYNINDSLHSSNSRAEENDGRNSEMNNSDKDPGIPDIGLNQGKWLPILDAFRTIEMIKTYQYSNLNQM